MSQRLADQIREDFRKEYEASDTKDEIISLIAEKLRQGEHGVVIAFNSSAKKVELKTYRLEWYEIHEKFRIPVMDYIRTEGFVATPGPLHCSINYKITL